MRQLVIECATEACSIALFDGEALLASHHQVLGRGHAERLIPLISELPDKGKAERILVSLGPGSFTGVRIGIAAARALGFAWGADVLGYPTLAMVAAHAQSRYPGKCTSVAMHAGHGEIFQQDFGGDGMPETQAASIRPEDAAARAVHPIIAGTQADMVQELRGHGIAATMHPDARHALLIPSPLITDDLTPIYGRAPDASLPSASKPKP